MLILILTHVDTTYFIPPPQQKNNITMANTLTSDARRARTNARSARTSAVISSADARTAGYARTRAASAQNCPSVDPCADLPPAVNALAIDAAAKAPTINALAINATAINAPATNNALAATVPSAEALAIDAPVADEPDAPAAYLAANVPSAETLAINAPAADELDTPAADELAITIPIADTLAHEVLAYKPTSTKRSFHCDSSSEEEDSKTEAIAESLAVLPDPVLATIIPQDLGSHYHEQHRKAFFSQAFGSERKKTGGEEKKKGNNSVCKPKEEFDAVIHAVHTFHVMNAHDKEGDLSEVEKKEFNKFKKDNK